MRAARANAGLVHLPSSKGDDTSSSVDSDILLQTAPDSTSAAAAAALGLPGPSILPPSAKLATAGNAAASKMSLRFMLAEDAQKSGVVRMSWEGKKYPVLWADCPHTIMTGSKNLRCTRLAASPAPVAPTFGGECRR